MLDSNTFAFGNLGSVRASIDISEGRGRADAEIIARSSRNANALIGFAGRVPPFLTQMLDNAEGSFSSIRQASGSFNSVEGGGEMGVELRTDAANQARRLSESLNGLKRIAEQTPTEPQPSDNGS